MTGAQGRHEELHTAAGARGQGHGGPGGLPSPEQLQDSLLLGQYGGLQGLRQTLMALPPTGEDRLQSFVNQLQTRSNTLAHELRLAPGSGNAIFERILPQLYPSLTPMAGGTGSGGSGGGLGAALGAATPQPSVSGGAPGSDGTSGGPNPQPPIPMTPQQSVQIQAMAQSLIAGGARGPAPHVWTGDALASEKPLKAIMAYTKAIELGAPPIVRVKRGVLADRAGDSELANADARAVLKVEPDNAAARSLFMLTRGRPSRLRVLDGGELADKGAPQDGQALTPAAAPAGLGQPAPQGDLRTAEQISAEENAALANRPADAQSSKLSRQAKAALKVGDVPSAVRISAEAVRVDPGSTDARYTHATALLRAQEPAAAAEQLSAALEVAPGNPLLLYTRAVAFGRQGLWQEAFSDADQAVQRSPRAGFPYQGRAGTEWGLKKRAEMLADLRQAAALDPRYKADLARASSLPDDVDPTLLFGQLPPSASKAPAGSSAPPLGYAVWGVLCVLAAGALVILWRRAPARAEAEPAAEPEAQVPPSAFWRRYDVVREIGAGGMGVVYEARDKSLERRVAVKRMRDEIRLDRRERERFLQEARTVAKMRHPNLVEIYSIEEDGDHAYLVFEFVEGKTLYDLISEKGALSPAETREVFRGICAGVDYAHGRGIVHRDLKPANVIVQPDGLVKVMDFGVSRQQDAGRQAMTNTVIGTPPYMAPEQEQGVVCAQSDVYALGVCLYEALSGVLPFQGTAGAVLLAKLAARYEPLEKKVPGLPPALYALVDRALDPKPETRIQSAAEFQKALDAAVAVTA
ncbi:MAG: protein kinase [Elusimicrobia bacterium]|nr:protein kinase [Elusimicrobiota bacterium]